MKYSGFVKLGVWWAERDKQSIKSILFISSVYIAKEVKINKGLFRV